MIMSWFWTGILLLCIPAAMVLGTGSELAAAVPKGAQAGLTLAASMAGSVCLWCGVGTLMEKAGLMDVLARFFRPVLEKLFPASREDPLLAGYLSSNLCANLLGLGNAATPMGIRAAQRLAAGSQRADRQLCRLIVLNTASLQLIPANVAAIRTQLGCATPFDILPAVWITSLTAALAGLLAAALLEKVWHP